MHELKKKNNQISLLLIAWAVNVCASSIVYPFLPIYLHEKRGVSMSVVGLLFLLMGVARIIGPVVSGVLVDSFGRRKILVSGPLLRSCFFFLLAALAGSQELLVSCIIV